MPFCGLCKSLHSNISFVQSSGAYYVKLMTNRQKVFMQTRYSKSIDYRGTTEGGPLPSPPLPSIESPLPSSSLPSSSLLSSLLFFLCAVLEYT